MRKRKKGEEEGEKYRNLKRDYKELCEEKKKK